MANEIIIRPAIEAVSILMPKQSSIINIINTWGPIIGPALGAIITFIGYFLIDYLRETKERKRNDDALRISENNKKHDYYKSMENDIRMESSKIKSNMTGSGLYFLNELIRHAYYYKDYLDSDTWAIIEELKEIHKECSERNERMFGAATQGKDYEQEYGTIEGKLLENIKDKLEQKYRRIPTIE